MFQKLSSKRNSLYAAIDVGSNSLRMLIGRCTAAGIQPELYQQQITRLGGGYHPGKGLASESMERTLSLLTAYAETLRQFNVVQVRAVATAAVRRAENSQQFVRSVKRQTGLKLEIIDGVEEARLSSAGVCSVLVPVPATALIFDIGGGSTELIFCQNRQIRFSRSYPIGVVQLCEELPKLELRQQYIADMVVKFGSDLLHAGVTAPQLRDCRLIGTAGTMTTLAALNQKMVEYDRTRINNHLLESDWLAKTLLELNRLSVQEREDLPGLEPGRGDIIIPGLELVCALCRYFRQGSLLVADAGLLEGILLDFCGPI